MKANIDTISFSKSVPMNLPIALNQLLARRYFNVYLQD